MSQKAQRGGGDDDIVYDDNGTDVEMENIFAGGDFKRDDDEDYGVENNPDRSGPLAIITYYNDKDIEKLKRVYSFLTNKQTTQNDLEHLIRDVSWAYLQSV